MSTLPPLQCRFAKRGCAHADELFKPAYQRVNRARGTKILRCFPHCCPAHIPRSYCGATVELRVKAAPGLRGDDLLVFARFRLRDEPAELRVGDRVALAAITRGVQSPSNTKAPWIQSRRSPASEQDDRADGNASFAFEINPGRRWYYSWHSSKNSAKRATKHVLEAFVFARDGDNVRCVAALTSPSFTLVSFRRVSASETALIAEELKDQDQDQATRAPVATTPRAPLRASLRVLIKDDQDQNSTISPPPRHHARRPQHLEPTSTRRHVDPVAVLFHAAQQYPTGDARPLIPTWIAIAESQRTLATIAPRSEAQLAAHLAGWLMLDAATQAAWRDHTRRGARALLNVSELRACYARWTRWLTSHVECVLATLAQPPLHELATALAPYELKDTAYCLDWRSFVAQAREEFTGVARLSRDVAFRVRANGPWVCPLEHVSVAAADAGDHEDHARQSAIRALPTTVLFAFWQQLSRLHIDLNTQTSPHELVLAAASSDHDGETDDHASPVMRLLLDNRLRSCHALPHGEAAMGAAASLLRGFSGDYIASQRRDGSIELDLFTWPSETQEAVRLRWTFARSDLSGERLDVNLLVAVAAFHGDAVGCSVREKLARVGAWRDPYKAHLLYTRDV